MWGMTIDEAIKLLEMFRVARQDDFGPRMTSLADVLRIYQGSNGEATKALSEEL
jgi:hypothetical protein